MQVTVDDDVTLLQILGDPLPPRARAWHRTGRPVSHRSRIVFDANPFHRRHSRTGRVCRHARHLGTARRLLPPGLLLHFAQVLCYGYGTLHAHPPGEGAPAHIEYNACPQVVCTASAAAGAAAAAAAAAAVAAVAVTATAATASVPAASLSSIPRCVQDSEGGDVPVVLVGNKVRRQGQQHPPAPSASPAV